MKKTHINTISYYNFIKQFYITEGFAWRNRDEDDTFNKLSNTFYKVIQ